MVTLGQRHHCIEVALVILQAHLNNVNSTIIVALRD